ncbi:hypothetical protein NPIL_670381 [Nephila pilipes]|uniref:Uncharacterized protein n=1 Tax=Nephila pilipes TaxID=299642 RepID=A0A8X6PIA6_NEPPI|nr:hypothetical protein NPIL_670381 [Nephila pilipes]
MASCPGSRDSCPRDMCDGSVVMQMNARNQTTVLKLQPRGSPLKSQRQGHGHGAPTYDVKTVQMLNMSTP